MKSTTGHTPDGGVPLYVVFATVQFFGTENIARVLEVEIKDLFEFIHLQPGGITAEGIREILAEMDEQTARTVFRMLRAAAR